MLELIIYLVSTEPVQYVLVLAKEYAEQLKAIERKAIFFVSVITLHSNLCNFIYDDSIVVIHKQISCTGRPVIMSINWKVKFDFLVYMI